MNTIDEACDFIGEWCGEPDERPGGPVTLSFAIPNCVLRLNARVGQLWQSARRYPEPLPNYPTPFFGLLEGQDRIVDPRRYGPDASGIIAFVWENQRVWRYGFNPSQVDRLFVSGDWCDGSDEAWRQVEATTEDALISTLLINLCMMSGASWDENVPKPESASVLLWDHPAWTTFDGFWTNDERTLIYFSGWQVHR